MGFVSGTLNLTTNAVSVLRSVKKEQLALRKDTESTSKALQKTWDKKWNAKVETSAAAAKMKSLKKKLEPFRKKIVTALAVKDAATAKVKSATAKVKAFGKMVASPVIKVKDQVSAGLSKIQSKLKSIGKAVAIPLVAGATAAVMALGATIGAGMQLEQQQVAMGHFIGTTNKDMSAAQVQAATDEYVAALRDNANATPFETGEVMAAGSRAVAISGGDTAGAMDLVTLAEDMAAASGGTKSIGDAMEALADAKMGEMERLKEFGFKVSAEDFQAKGFEGVTGDLDEFFGGAAEKLAGTGAGLLSTIKGKLKSAIADVGLGLVEKLKPTFEKIIGFIDKMQPAFEAFGGMIADRLGSAVDFIMAVLPGAMSLFSQFSEAVSGAGGGFDALMPAFQTFGQSMMGTLQQVASAMMPVIGSIVSTIQTVLPAILPVISTVVSTIGGVISSAAPLISGLVQGIGTAITTLAPIVSTIFGGIGSFIGEVVGFLGSRMGFLQGVFSTVFSTVASILTTAWGIIGPILDIAMSVFKILWSVVEAVFPAIEAVISTVWNILQPIFEGLGKALGWVADGIGWLADKVTGFLGDGKEAPAAEAAAPASSMVQPAASGAAVPASSMVPVPASSAVAPATAGVPPPGPTGGTSDPVSVDVNWDDFPQPDPASPSPYGAGGGGMAMAPVPADMTATPMAAQPVTQNIDQSVTVSIASLAGSITIKEEVDIDAVAARVVSQVTTAIQNTQAVPTPA